MLIETSYKRVSYDSKKNHVSLILKPIVLSERVLFEDLTKTDDNMRLHWGGNTLKINEDTIVWSILNPYESINPHWIRLFKEKIASLPEREAIFLPIPTEWNKHIQHAWVAAIDTLLDELGDMSVKFMDVCNPHFYSDHEIIDAHVRLFNMIESKIDRFENKKITYGYYHNSKW